jgi:adenine-specific DNA-methyltransferase
MPSLNWLGKDKVLNHHLDVPFRALKQVSSFGDSEAASRNKIIHGDNLLALKSLLPEFEGRIRCIYIDPPYNTGNEAWTYNDNVSDPRMLRWLGQVVGHEGEDLTRHDKWLCMMYPRLKLLRQLLSEDGSIWISIDDNEVASLKLVMNEVFGESNFVASVVWQRRTSPDSRLMRSD